MKCVICHSSDIQERDVEETIQVGNDIIILPVRVLVCLNCGERYYDRKTMQQLEKLEQQVRDKQAPLQTVGAVRRLSSPVT
jgi:YgiT-type zinc finger domain-containing protein